MVPPSEEGNNVVTVTMLKALFSEFLGAVAAQFDAVIGKAQAKLVKEAVASMRPELDRIEEHATKRATELEGKVGKLDTTVQELVGEVRALRQEGPSSAAAGSRGTDDSVAVAPVASRRGRRVRTEGVALAVVTGCERSADLFWAKGFPNNLSAPRLTKFVREALVAFCPTSVAASGKVLAKDSGTSVRTTFLSAEEAENAYTNSRRHDFTFTVGPVRKRTAFVGCIWGSETACL